jgi:hypothetical protein
MEHSIPQKVGVKLGNLSATVHRQGVLAGLPILTLAASGQGKRQQTRLVLQWRELIAYQEWRPTLPARPPYIRGVIGT